MILVVPVATVFFGVDMSTFTMAKPQLVVELFGTILVPMPLIVAPIVAYVTRPCIIYSHSQNQNRGRLMVYSEEKR